MTSTSSIIVFHSSGGIVVPPITFSNSVLDITPLPSVSKIENACSNLYLVSTFSLFIVAITNSNKNVINNIIIKKKHV